MRTLALSLLALAAARSLAAQQWTPMASGTSSEFRGLHAVDAQVVWAAGKGGVVARTLDGGRNWTAEPIYGAERLFLVAIHALDARRAWALGTSFDSTSLARVYFTSDGGTSWQLQYQNASKGTFFDGMAFWDERHGIAFGDPQDGRLVVITTEDGGGAWTQVFPSQLPAVLPGEAAFAASGTAIAVSGNSEVWIATGGGARARVFHSTNRGRTWEVFDTPANGSAAKGLFGIAMDGRRGVAVGGDYRQRDASAENLLLSDDGGRSWQLAASPGLLGVQYGVAHGGGRRFVAAGPGGSALSTDGGTTWQRLEGPGYNTVACAKGVCWAAGVDGRIARLSP